MRLFKFGDERAELPKMVGAFLIVIAVLMLVQSGAVMFDSWQTVRDFDGCIVNAYKSADDLGITNGLNTVVYELRAQECKNSLYQITGAQIPGGVFHMTTRQMWTAVLGPVVNFFIWAVVFLFALYLFNNGSVVIPVEDADVPMRPFAKKRK